MRRSGYHRGEQERGASSCLQNSFPMSLLGQSCHCLPCLLQYCKRYKMKQHRSGFKCCQGLGVTSGKPFLPVCCGSSSSIACLGCKRGKISLCLHRGKHMQNLCYLPFSQPAQVLPSLKFKFKFWLHPNIARITAGFSSQYFVRTVLFIGKKW